MDKFVGEQRILLTTVCVLCYSHSSIRIYMNGKDANEDVYKVCFCETNEGIIHDGFEVVECLLQSFIHLLLETISKNIYLR